MAKIELIEVTKAYWSSSSLRLCSKPNWSGSPSTQGSSFVIDRLSLTVADGELLVLLGPTGCGKSTTLRLIAGLEACDSGQILIDGVAAESAPHKRNLSFVFQEAALFPHLSVADNIAFGIGSNPDAGVFDVLRRFIRPVKKLFSHRRSNPTEAGNERDCGIETRVRLTARRLGIEHLLNRQPHQLSGGERQRVALGRAIVRNPAAFLLDEPLSSVDQWQRTQIRTEIRKIQKDTQTSMVYVTHDLAEAVAVADRIAVMKEGKILQTGTPAELLYQPNCLFVAQFMGQFPMNWLVLPTGFATQSRNNPEDKFAWPAVDDGPDPDGPDPDDRSGHGWCIVGIRAHLISVVSPEQGNLKGRIIDRRLACEGEVFEVELLLGDKLRQKKLRQTELGQDAVGVDAVGVMDWMAEDWMAEKIMSGGSKIWTVHIPTSRNATSQNNLVGNQNHVVGRQEIKNNASGNEAGGNEARSPTPAVGETIGLKFDSKDLHFFDLQTGQNLRKELDETK